MKNFRKQFFLDNVESANQLRKVEFDLNNVFKNENVKINYDTKIITIEFKDDNNIENNTKTIIDVIKKVNNEIEVVEREIKPTYRKVLILENLDCAACASKIERIAKRTFDHELIVVDFASTRFIIESSDFDLINNLEERVSQITTSVDANVKVTKKTHQNQSIKSSIVTDEIKKTNFIIGLAIFALGFIAKTILQSFPNVHPLIILTIIYVTYTFGYILIAGDILYGAFKNIKSGRIFDEQFLMSLATVTALLVGYYDEAVFVIIFYKFGELLQQNAVNYSRKSIAALIDIQPQTAHLLVSGEIVEIDPMEVVVGDIIYLRPDDRIPLDGVVIEGSSSLDVSALTGESIHKEVSTGDEVLSGSINMDGILKVRVTKIYKESMVSKILNLVENASSLKSKSENFITKFAKYYTPTVVIIAVLLAIILPFVIPTFDLTWINGFKKSIMVALIFLVVSCPCALVISIPLGFFGGIGASSKQGILVKGSNYLEALNSVNTFVFDKTGTLTKGKFSVDDVVTFGSYSKDKLLEIAAHAEINSNHLVARSIVEAYGLDKISVSRVEMKKQLSRNGINNIVDKLEVHVGQIEFLAKHNILVPEVNKSTDKVFVAISGKTEGYIVIKDQVKEGAKNSIKMLKDLGIRKTIMLTGDTKQLAEKTSKYLGIDEYYANMSPIDKVEKLVEIKTKLEYNQKIAFVGDGINDAPVLSSADIGIAMGGLGSDAAIQVADIVLMTDDIGKLPMALKIAKKTKRIVIENIVLALTVKVMFLLLALFGPFLQQTIFASLVDDFLIYEAIFADVGVSLLAILNSLRVMRIKK